MEVASGDGVKRFRSKSVKRLASILGKALSFCVL